MGGEFIPASIHCRALHVTSAMTFLFHLKSLQHFPSQRKAPRPDQQGRKSLQCSYQSALYSHTHTNATLSANRYRNYSLSIHSSLIRQISRCLGCNIAPQSHLRAVQQPTLCYSGERKGETAFNTEHSQGKSAPSYRSLQRPFSAQGSQSPIFWVLSMSLFLQLPDSPL